ncbi:hypothetical protein HM1_0428 [Heliomicrobium modesticaldum Ice1]|uniref:Uncharacterized protein n=1 Tax=Heliobacterium modesticaldum (strain ATCC 51547 / Ice1) TaxID=498761 RepID=B0TFE6_HELMI|nr:hypothetical protein HM1_0428 [Heliomicrobium modesticaldum Ice1]
MEDYAQPYSPYDIDDQLDEAFQTLNKDSRADGSHGLLEGTDRPAPGVVCTHLFVCPQCGSDRQLPIPRRFI